MRHKNPHLRDNAPQPFQNASDSADAIIEIEHLPAPRKFLSDCGSNECILVALNNGLDRHSVLRWRAEQGQISRTRQ